MGGDGEICDDILEQVATVDEDQASAMGASLLNQMGQPNFGILPHPAEIVGEHRLEIGLNHQTAARQARAVKNHVTEIP